MIYKHRLAVKSRKTLEHSVLDFRSITKYADNVGINEKEFLSVNAVEQKLNIKWAKNINGLFCPAEKLYFTCEDGFLYKQNETDFVRIYNLDGEKIKFCLRLDGLKIKGDLFFTEKFCVLVDESGFGKTLNVPSCDTAEVYAGMLFTGKNHKINYSALLNANDFSLGDLNGGYILLGRESGKIISLVKRKDVLIIFCERSVFELCAYGDSADYNLKQIAVNPYNESINFAELMSDQKILVKIGEKLYFFSDEKFSLADSFINNGGYEIIGSPACDGANYFMPVKQIKKDYCGIFCRLSDKTECVVSCDKPIVTKKGHLLRSGKVFKIEKGCSEDKYVWQSIPLDFGVIENKAILEVRSQTNGDVKLNISGQRSNNVLMLKNGYDAKKLNAEGQSFVLTINGKQSATLKDLKFKYVKKGE